MEQQKIKVKTIGTVDTNVFDENFFEKLLNRILELRGNSTVPTRND